MKYIYFVCILLFCSCQNKGAKSEDKNQYFELNKMDSSNFKGIYDFIVSAVLLVDNNQNILDSVFFSTDINLEDSPYFEGVLKNNMIISGKYTIRIIGATGEEVNISCLIDNTELIKEIKFKGEMFFKMDTIHIYTAANYINMTILKNDTFADFLYCDKVYADSTKELCIRHTGGQGLKKDTYTIKLYAEEPNQNPTYSIKKTANNSKIMLIEKLTKGIFSPDILNTQGYSNVNQEKQKMFYVINQYIEMLELKAGDNYIISSEEDLKKLLANITNTCQKINKYANDYNNEFDGEFYANELLKLASNFNNFAKDIKEIKAKNLDDKKKQLLNIMDSFKTLNQQYYNNIYEEPFLKFKACYDFFQQEYNGKISIVGISTYVNQWQDDVQKIILSQQ